MTDRGAKISEGWQTGYREGYETKEIRVGDCKVRIHSPILGAEEKALREKEVEAALGSLNRKEF